MLPEGTLLGAVDLGSNSFHLMIARIEHGELRPVEALAEKVQLGAGLEDGILSADAIERGLACLSRFAQLLESVEPERLRVVGTNALRAARNRREFTRPAREILGTRVDVIYGLEEARLVYLGVAHTLADDAQSRLVIDIGGGSTEFIIGERFEPRRLQSRQMGCVSFGNRFFPDQEIRGKYYKRAYKEARLEAFHIRRDFSAKHWEECVGSSGTLQAIEAALVTNGWAESGIDRDGLAKLESKLLDFKHMKDIQVEGLPSARREVILPGVAIASALFDELGIKQMRTSKGALREGVLYDLMGRLQHEDVRERTVNALCQRYATDASTADMVEQRARMFYSATHKVWKLGKAEWELLHWASRCHEIGMTIAHKHHNRHGAYLLRNADLPGFSQDEQEQLALLVLGHRGKPLPEILALQEEDPGNLRRLLAILRLATRFKYVEQLEQLPEFTVLASENSLTLDFPENWLEDHPLTAFELEREQSTLGKLGLELNIR